jgi:hypothetical protein
VVLDTAHFAHTNIARVEPTIVLHVCGVFAFHEPGRLVLLGKWGKCVVVNGVGVLPAARIASAYPPEFDPYTCANVLVNNMSIYGLTVIAVGLSICTFADVTYDAVLKAPGPAATLMQFATAVQTLSDPIVQACSGGANRLVVVTRAGHLSRQR